MFKRMPPVGTRIVRTSQYIKGHNAALLRQEFIELALGLLYHPKRRAVLMRSN
jgi:hypothetical protein